MFLNLLCMYKHHIMSLKKCIKECKVQVPQLKKWYTWVHFYIFECGIWISNHKVPSVSIVIGSASLVRQTTERVNPLKVLFRFNIISKLKSAKPNNQLIIWVPEALAIDDSKSDYTMTNKPIPFNAKVLTVSAKR